MLTSYATSTGILIKNLVNLKLFARRDAFN